ncbi:hypothetical protein KR009_005451 [Drosophila setifemur]|nr:hypothetical protein KR009_005451 [Drosophila setifemur]
MWRLHKCCYCIGLRRGCILIAVVDFIFNVLVLALDADEIIGHIEKAVAICHCIGCVFLLSSSLVRSTILLMLFLITSMTNMLLLTMFCILDMIFESRHRWIVVPSCTAYICISIYFWIVVYSFYIQGRPPNEVEEV